MDWLKLFTLLVAVASITVNADGPKKKIRIHLPQKVKHIHHHKKIYITNHPAPSQYAPAYMPSAEGSVAVPSSVALPAMANIIPFNSVDLYEEPQSSLPHISQGASQILPLYHARGYYGPTPTDIDEQEYDSVPSDSEYNTPIHSSHPKKVKIIRLNDQPRKKVIRKPKPKRLIVHNKPHPTASPDVEHPVSTFHEHFYSDVDGTGTIRKIRKPQRFEKIVDGDTEHIHTYSEEHIHKLFFDQGPKIAGVVGVDPLTGMSSITGGQAIIPLKGSPTILALPTRSFAGLTAVSPIANSPQFEYAAYNPREVTHDHIFHDHGEITAEVESNKEALGLPPKVSYNKQGLKISGNQKRPKTKNPQKPKKINKPTDLSYYESIYTNKPSKQRPTISEPTFDATGESDFQDFRTNQDIGYRETYKKPHNPSFYGKTSNDYSGQQASVPAPFTVSSTVHGYKPKSFSAPAPVRHTKIRDHFANFKDAYPNTFEYDTYASSSNLYTSEDKNDGGYAQDKRSNKKSISTQNINFGGQDHMSYVDHIDSESTIDDIDDAPTALENLDDFDESQVNEAVTPASFLTKDLSAAQQYFSLMAKKLQGEQVTMPEVTNDNYRYADVPISSTTSYPQGFTSSSPPTQHNNQNIIGPASDASMIRDNLDTKTSNRSRKINQHKNLGNVLLDNREQYGSRPLQNQETNSQDQRNASSIKGKLKYGDKI